MDSKNRYDITLPLNFDGSINQDLLTEATSGPHLEYRDGSVPMVAKTNTGRMSPVRARTMKEYDTQIADLKKENFSLKLRIYFLEERIQQKFGDGEDLFKTNIELKVEVESLKKDLAEKQELLVKASSAIESVTANGQAQLQEAREQVEKELLTSKRLLEDQLDSTKKELEASQRSLQEATHQMTDLENQIDQLKTEIRHIEQSKDIQLQGLKEDLDAKQKELDLVLDENKNCKEKEKQLQDDNDQLNGQVQKLEKEVTRRDRDLEDEFDDQKENMEQLEKKMEGQEAEIQKKAEMLGALEDLLKKKEEQNKDLGGKLKEAEEELDKQKEVQSLSSAVIKGFQEEVRGKNQKVDDLTEQLKDKEDEIKKVKDELHDLTMKKHKAFEKQHDDLTFLEDKMSSMQVQMKERELEIENLLKSLGKKEGELEGFKELLEKAENALKQSEEAVQDLQEELNKERSKASSNCKLQELEAKIDDLKAQLESKERVIQQQEDVIKDKERQMEQCMEIFKPDTQGEQLWKDDLLKSMQEKLKQKDKALEEAMSEKFKMTEAKEEEIHDLKLQLKDREYEMERANQMLLTTEETIELLEKEGRDKDKSIKHLSNSLKAAQKSMEEALASHRKALTEKDAIMMQMETALAEKNKLLQDALNKVPDWDSEDMLKSTIKSELLQEMAEDRKMAAIASVEATDSLIKRLQDKDKELLRNAEMYDKDLKKQDKEINNLKAELQRAQKELQEAENQFDKLKDCIRDKDKTIETLMDSGQEKDKMIAQLQKRRSSDMAFTEMNKFKEQVEQLKEELDDKNRLIESMKIEIAVKTEALKSAKETERDLREQLSILNSRLDKIQPNQKEVHRSEREVYHVRDPCEGQGSHPENISGVGIMSDPGLQETLRQQLEELRKLSSVLQKERQIVLNLSENRNTTVSPDDHSRAFEIELAAVQALRRELEEGVERNNQMRLILDRQLRGHQNGQTESTEESTHAHDVINRLTQDLSTLKKDLSAKQQENDHLLRHISDLEQKYSVSNNPENGNVSLPREQASPSGLSRTWSAGGATSPDSDIPLNRQSLSDMTAPMLRRFIRQLQQQLNAAEKENLEMRKRLNLSWEFRDIPGRNEDDSRSIPQLRVDIESLQHRLTVQSADAKKMKEKLCLGELTGIDWETVPNVKDLQNEILRLKEQHRNSEEVISLLKKQISLNTVSEAAPGGLNPELIVQMAEEIQKLKRKIRDSRSEKGTTESSCQTPAISMLPSLVPKMNGNQKVKGSQIPRLQRSGGHLISGDHQHMGNPEMMKSLLSEAKSRIEELEEKLSGTEGTVRLQTQKMKYYKSLLEDHGLMSKSPAVTRSNSDTNLAAIGLDRGGSNVVERATSHENLKTLANSSVPSPLGPSFPQGSSTTKDNHRNGLPSDIQRNANYTQTNHSLDDQFISRDGLWELHQKVLSLQRHLQETKDNNFELKKKLDQKLRSEQIIAELQDQVHKSQETVADLEEKLTGMQNSSVQHVLESQKDEICVLKKKLSDSQNSCIQLSKWLDELSEFLSGLIFYGTDGDPEQQLRGMKQKIDKSRMVAKSMSSVLGTDEDSPHSPLHSDEQNVATERDIADHLSLSEKLRRKSLEVQHLTEGLKQRDEDLRQKNSIIGQLNHDLLIVQNKLLMFSESAKSSTTSGGSAADGNVYGNGYRGDRLSFLRESESPGSQSVMSDRMEFVQKTQNGVDTVDSGHSPERLRHPTLGDHTQTQVSRLQRSSDDLDIHEEASTCTTNSVHSNNARRTTSEDLSHFKKSYGRGSSVGKDGHTIYTNMFDTDERMYGFNRFADREVFDDTLTPMFNGRDISMLDGKQLFHSTKHTFNGLDNSTVHDVSSDRPSEVLPGEVDRLRERLHVVEDLNKTLKDELNLYENLCTSIGVQGSPQRSPNKTTTDLDNDLLRQHLAEIRAARIQLEKSVKDSDKLCKQLQREIDNHEGPSSTTTNVHVYSQQQAHFNELQQTIDKLKQQIREKEDVITEKITVIREKERIISEFKSIILEKEERIQEVTSEKERQLKSGQQTLVLQQRRIHQQDETLDQMQKKLELQEESLHQQENKLKEQYEIIQQQGTKLESQSGVIQQQGTRLDTQSEMMKQKDLKLDKQSELMNQQASKMRKQTELITQQDRRVKDLTADVERKVKLIQELERRLDSVHNGTIPGQGHGQFKHLETKLMQQERAIKSQEEQLSKQKKLLTEKDKVNMKLQQSKERLDENLRKSGKDVKRLQQEIQMLREQAQETKDLNKTLKLELSVYEKLENAENEDTNSGNGVLPGDFDIRELLTEIRLLRIQLEKCIDTNNSLRQKLEEHLAHRHHVKTTNIIRVHNSSPPTSQDAPDGQPTPEKPFSETNGVQKVTNLSIEKGRYNHKEEDHEGCKDLSRDTSLTDSMSVASSQNDHLHFSTGLSTWPQSSKLEDAELQKSLLAHTLSSPGGTLHRSQMNLSKRTYQSDCNLSYHVDDPPSLLADITSNPVDSDIRNLFAIGKLDDYEKLKKENGECLIVLKGIEARIQERLKIFRSMSPKESVEYSTLKELSMSAENLRICLSEEKSLISCFWTSTLPSDDNSKTKLMSENETLHLEMAGLKTKYDLLAKIVENSEQRLHATNQQKASMEDFIYRQLKKTSKVMTHARENFEKGLGMEKKESSRSKHKKSDFDTSSASSLR